MRILGTVCARGGSKGVPDKNIAPINGRPLISYTLQRVRESGLADVIAVSSDSDRILEVADEWGADLLIKRPDILASDSAGKLPAIRHCTEEAEGRVGGRFDVVMDFDVTSPLRSPQDIRGAHRRFVESNATNLLTACPARRSPYFNLLELDSQGRVHLSKGSEVEVLRRQDAPPCYDMNASIYIWTRESLFSRKGLFQEGTVLYVMPEERSVDIDTDLDFKLVSLLLAEGEDQS